MFFGTPCSLNGHWPTSSKAVVKHGEHDEDDVEAGEDDEKVIETVRQFLLIYIR